MPKTVVSWIYLTLAMALLAPFSSVEASERAGLDFEQLAALRSVSGVALSPSSHALTSAP